MRFRFAALTLAVSLIILVSAGASAQSNAAALYRSKCQVCHGADGKGDTPAGKKLGAKNFQSPEVAKMSDAELIEAVKKGKGKMQGYQGKLSDVQIKALVKYVRGLKSQRSGH